MNNIREIRYWSVTCFYKPGKNFAVQNQRSGLFFSVRRTGKALVRFRAHLRGSESHSSVCGCGEVSKTRNSGSRNRFVIIMKRELEPQRTQRSTEQNHRGLPH